MHEQAGGPAGSSWKAVHAPSPRAILRRHYVSSHSLATGVYGLLRQSIIRAAATRDVGEGTLRLRAILPVPCIPPFTSKCLRRRRQTATSAAVELHAPPVYVGRCDTWTHLALASANVSSPIHSALSPNLYFQCKVRRLEVELCDVMPPVASTIMGLASRRIATHHLEKSMASREYYSEAGTHSFPFVHSINYHSFTNVRSTVIKPVHEN